MTNVFILIFSLAEEAMIDGQSVSYCQLEDKFKDYTQDCWTYDGRLMEN